MKKAVIIILSVFAGLLLLVFGAQFFIAHKIRQAVDDRLPSLTNGAYEGDIGGVSVNLFNRSVNLKDITIRSDVGNRPDSAAASDLYLHVDNIRLGGIKFRSRDHLIQLSLRSIDIRTPYASLSEDKKVVAPGDSSASLSLIERINKTFSSIGAQRITVTDGHFDYKVRSAGDTLKYEAEGIGFRADGMLIDTAAVSTKRILYSDDVAVSLDRFTYTFLGQTTLLEVTSVDIDTRSGRGSVKSFRMVPQLSKDRYAWVAPGHADWTKLEVGRVELYGMDVDRFESDNFLRVDSISIASLDVDSYKNRKIQRVEKVKPLLHETLQSIPFGLEVGVIELRNAKANYDELAVNGDRPGNIFFTDLSGTFRDLTNTLRPEKPWYTLTASGKLMGAGVLRANFTLPTGKGNNSFKISGSLGKMSMSHLNRILEPLIRGEVETGTIDGVTFSMSGNPNSAWTRLTLLYDDLKISIMKSENGVDVERRALSGLANFLLIKDSNPDKWGTRTTEASSVRDPYRSQFNYLWKMLLPGLKETIGVPDKNATTDVDADNLKGFDGRPAVNPKGIFQDALDRRDDGNNDTEDTRVRREREDDDQNSYRGIFGRKRDERRRG